MTAQTYTFSVYVKRTEPVVVTRRKDGKRRLRPAVRWEPRWTRVVLADLNRAQADTLQEWFSTVPVGSPAFDLFLRAIGNGACKAQLEAGGPTTPYIPTEADALKVTRIPRRQSPIAPSR